MEVVGQRIDELPRGVLPQQFDSKQLTEKRSSPTSTAITRVQVYFFAELQRIRDQGVEGGPREMGRPYLLLNRFDKELRDLRRP